MRSSKHETRQRGGALILMTVMVASLLIPMVGLAIDGGILFLIKAKLQAAVRVPLIILRGGILPTKGGALDIPPAGPKELPRVVPVARR